MMEDDYVILTGLTEDELKETISEMEETDAEPVKRCYLCKRNENDTSVALSSDSEKGFIFAPVKLWEAGFNLPDGSLIFIHFCTECYLIMQHIGQMADKDEGPLFDINNYSSNN